MDLGTLAAIWVYPVKSLAPTPLERTRIEPNGLPGDRERALLVRSGHAREGKTYRGKEHNLLHLQHEIEAGVAVAAQRGVHVDVESNPQTRFFDAGSVSLIFNRWIDEVSHALGDTLDPLRWRPNLYARACAEFSFGETDLVDRVIDVGEVVLRVSTPIERCVTTTYDQQTGESNPEVLRYVAQHRANVMGVYCEVERAGTVRVGEALRLRAR